MAEQRPGFFESVFTSAGQADRDALIAALQQSDPEAMAMIESIGPENVGFGGLTSGLKAAARQGVFDKLRRVMGAEMGAGPLGKEVGQGFAEAIVNPIKQLTKQFKLTPSQRDLLINAPREGEEFTRSLLKRYQRILTGE